MIRKTLKQSAPITAENVPLKGDLQKRAIGAYLGLAVGDALGATTEFLTPREVQYKHGVHRDICGGGWLRLKPGQVTDDTEMSLALGRAIIENDGVEPVAVGHAFSEWMRSKPVDIGNTVRRGIVHFRNSGEPFVPINENDAGNGACMRSLPIALAYWNAPEEVLAQASRMQSHITHHAPVADAGTETVLKMVISALKAEPRERLEQIALLLVEEHPVYRYDKKKTENPSAWLVETLRVVFQAFFAHDDFESILVDTVNLGGDADTTGAIAGMLAGACYGVDAIPKRWKKALNKQVREACEQQALELLAVAAKR